MTSKQQKGSGSIIAIITMIFLFAMIAFVTNLAAPIGTIWKGRFEGNDMLGMMGNMMNFAAYLIMGIPAGKLLTKIGYKKTALIAIVTGFVGVLIQFLSGKIGADAVMFSLPTSFIVYLLGAFVAGFCVCMLNTVVNPMLNLLAGGGNKGSQLLQIGGTFNSLTATVTPIFVGALIGSVTKDTLFSDVNPVLYIAMAVFAASFLILLFVPIQDPQQEGGNQKFEHSPWNFRHFVMGVIGIFIYVGVEVGIPATLLYFLSDITAKGAGLDPANATAIAGSVAGTYWFLMMIGRFIGGAIGNKVSAKAMLTVASGLGVILILAAMFGPSSPIKMPVFAGSDGFAMVEVPIKALFLVLCGLCTSVMWGGIFNIATEGLGKYTPMASGIFMMMVVGGGVLPLIQSGIANATTYMTSYIVPLLGLAYLFFYAVAGSKNVNKDIPV